LVGSVSTGIVACAAGRGSATGCMSGPSPRGRTGWVWSMLTRTDAQHHDRAESTPAAQRCIQLRLHLVTSSGVFYLNG
jgi:hypothetical protein